MEAQEQVSDQNKDENEVGEEKLNRLTNFGDYLEKRKLIESQMTTADSHNEPSLRNTMAITRISNEISLNMSISNFKTKNF